MLFLCFSFKLLALSSSSSSVCLLLTVLSPQSWQLWQLCRTYLFFSPIPLTRPSPAAPVSSVTIIFTLSHRLLSRLYSEEHIIFSHGEVTDECQSKDASEFLACNFCCLVFGVAVASSELASAGHVGVGTAWRVWQPTHTQRKGYCSDTLLCGESDIYTDCLQVERFSVV